jgi:ABC-type oligopeptide transport system substrate-binding subunit
MNSKKVLSIVLAIMMTLTLIVGCGKDSVTTTTPDAPATDNGTTTDDVATPDTASGEPITLTLACMGDQADTFENLNITEVYNF